MRHQLDRGETFVVDNGHLVAWNSGMSHEMGLATQKGGLMSRLMTSATSGEGLMCHFTGPGEVFLQTHKPNVGPATDGQSSKQQAHPLVGLCFLCIFGSVFLLVVCAVVYAAINGELEVNSGGNHRHERIGRDY